MADLASCYGSVDPLSSFLDSFVIFLSFDKWTSVITLFSRKEKLRVRKRARHLRLWVQDCGMPTPARILLARVNHMALPRPWVGEGSLYFVCWGGDPQSQEIKISMAKATVKIQRQ